MRFEGTKSQTLFPKNQSVVYNSLYIYIVYKTKTPFPKNQSLCDLFYIVRKTYNIMNTKRKMSTLLIHFLPSQVFVPNPEYLIRRPPVAH